MNRRVLDDCHQSRRWTVVGCRVCRWFEQSLVRAHRGLSEYERRPLRILCFEKVADKPPSLASPSLDA